ncbi:MAG: DUF58 domain-containing protein [Proteobacteria bacterium]|nr:DUF58 domain-containing protein [Pseudomonadota bacterium]MCP4918880.1 DUF58 domain-containing protein [Pseudomonadota bacterium]
MDLSPELLAKLELLRIATRRVHSGRYAARTRSRRLGAGIDFADHRSYTPGDDLKYVDWTLYGRLDQLMIRLSEEETELNVHLLVDCSRSMDLDVGEGQADTKAHIAKEITTALAYVALSNLDQVHIWPFAGELGRPLRPARRRAEVVRVWKFLGEQDLAPGTDIDGAVKRMLQLTRSRGVAILISDLPGDAWRGAVERLLHERYDVGVVHLQAPGEIDLPLDGERFDLVDGETGEVMHGVTREQIQALRKQGREDRRDIAAFCRRRGVPLVQTTTGDPTDVEQLVLTLLRGKGLLR